MNEVFSSFVHSLFLQVALAIDVYVALSPSPCWSESWIVASLPDCWSTAALKLYVSPALKSEPRVKAAPFHSADLPVTYRDLPE